jgi:dihydroorotase
MLSSEKQNHRCKSPFHNKTVDILVVDGFIKKDNPPNSDETEEIKLIISMYHKVGLTAAFRLVNQVKKGNCGLSVAAKAALRLLTNPFPIVDNQVAFSEW